MDDYLAGLSPGDKAALERVRAVVLGAVPEAEEGRSYGMPAFIYAGRPLLGFRAAKKHLSISPSVPRRSTPSATASATSTSPRAPSGSLPTPLCPRTC
jgi:uncharacterized protein YdhG (YjbR/CyaY superfamily)